MTQNEFNGMAIAFIVLLFTLIAGVIAVTRYFASQRDFDKLIYRVEEMEKKQIRSDMLVAKLDITMKNLDRSVRDLAGLIRHQQRQAVGPIPLPPYQAESYEEENGDHG